ncbi:MAG: 1-(5-phosphoribosyl)-5-[(5-phosphoribosylamino)methylideneamino]imidazole-4-carboxamide isomerase [Bacteroidaceae bacterium]|nr:1-(5-phosphoribosyl)-5-[(5-phosphoribosylamino)methylideneamino]imidazole-4-carboxamide isomerase [Bacteroidaceae bacterium]
MILIPAIDVIDGKCVRLTKGNYATKKVYNEDPVALAREFEALGFRRLHVVDLDGARSHHVVNHRTLEAIATATGLVIDFGGGIKTEEDLHIAFESGAAMATVGSIAVTRQDLFLEWLDMFGADKLILGADVRDGLISINGWKEESQSKLLPFLKEYLARGVKHVLCTDISKDGMLQGPATDLYKQILENYPTCGLIASGGISSIEDIRALDKAGIPAAVFGKAIYEGKIDLPHLIDEFPQI